MRKQGGGRSLPAGSIDAALAAAAGSLVALLLSTGCAREAPDVREVRSAAQSYVNALARKNLEEIRRTSTCVVPVHSIRGGNVLRVGSAHRLTLGALDSLARAASLAHRAADSTWARGAGLDREALFQNARRAAKVHISYRNAIRAASLSQPDSLHGTGTPLETRDVRMRVRYAGGMVGSKPVDREQILRLVRAPSGRWIVFSLDAVEDDPRPHGV